MRLNSIKLAGFKSFVDPVHLVFNSNLTAIVGPNGCGKSNIVDAIQCVLGGSSAKNVRAELMADVIFNGTSTRKPIAQASIELQFHNTEGKISGEYARYPEIAIRRELNRDGESTYYINEVRCRRRDITDIFLGTGLGPNSYAIIGQGMISRLIEAKPEDLRVFVEEAAGISKYKERRRETENRIRHTRENLDRLSDIREELQKQLQHLQKQANAAERYKLLKQEQRVVKAQLHAIQYRALGEQTQEIKTKINHFETLLEAKNSTLRHIDKEVENYNDQRITINDAFNEVQSEFYSLGSDVSRIEQQIIHNKEKQSQLDKDLQNIKTNTRETQEQLAQDQFQIEELSTEITQLEIQITSAQEQSSQAQEILNANEKQMVFWQEKWEMFNSSSSELSKQSEVANTQLHHLTQKRDQLHQRLQRLEAEQTKQDKESLQDAINILSQEKDEYYAKKEVLNVQANVQADEILTLRKTIQELQGDLNSANQHLRNLTAKQTTLEALQKVALGKNDQSVISWLETNQLQSQLRLAEGIRVAKGWEHAVETVLGNFLEAICVNNFSEVIKLSKTLEKSKLTLFNKTNLKDTLLHQTKNPISTLIDKVKSDLPIKFLLSNIYAVSTLEEALEVLPTLQESESVITKDGIWLSNSWMKVSHTVDEKSGILQREQDLEEITAEINNEQELVKLKESNYEKTLSRLSDCEQWRDELQQQLHHVTLKYGELLAGLSAKEERLKQIEQRTLIIEQEKNESHEQIEEVAQHLSNVQVSLENLKNQIMDDSAEREKLLTQRDRLRIALEESRSKASLAKQEYSEMQIRLESSRNQIHYLKQNIHRSERQIESFTQQQNHLENTLSDLDKPLMDLKNNLQEKLAERVKIESRLAEIRQSLEKIDQVLKKLNQERNQTEAEIEKQRNELEQSRLQSQTLLVKQSTHLEQVQTNGFNLEELLAEVSVETSCHDWEEKINRIETRIQRLGAINLAAIDEFSQLSERKTYLDKQNDDLIEALTTLETAIRKIDRETRTRFKETFEKLNDSFKNYFIEIFNGGDAYLELTSDDLLETGVIVRAQPPGKRNSTIHLLSGGEKALTAIALVFAIFNLNPAPFCILDEVDAPLDDINVGRFCNLVRKMSEKVQFIFISHNKITIEMGQQLAGVTMQEAGVSRMVSVDVNEAIALANA